MGEVCDNSINNSRQSVKPIGKVGSLKKTTHRKATSLSVVVSDEKMELLASLEKAARYSMTYEEYLNLERLCKHPSKTFQDPEDYLQKCINNVSRFLPNMKKEILRIDIMFQLDFIRQQLSKFGKAPEDDFLRLRYLVEEANQILDVTEARIFLEGFNFKDGLFTS